MRGICLAAMVVAAVLSGCQDPEVARATIFCSIACQCTEAPVDEVQQECVDQCVAESGQFIDQLSETCFACITSHADQCATIETDCEPVCNFDGGGGDPPPPPELGDAGVPMPVDAF